MPSLIFLTGAGAHIVFEVRAKTRHTEEQKRWASSQSSAGITASRETRMAINSQSWWARRGAPA